MNMTESDWIQYFLANAAEPCLPWDDGHRLSGAERAVVIESIQQFQLGENAQGRRLLQRAHVLDAEFVQALRLFIKEEQRHSDLLGRFLKAQGSPCFASALGPCRISASARMGRAGSAHASAGYGRSARDPLLHSSAGCDRIAAAAVDLQPNMNRRNRAFAVSSIHVRAPGIASGGVIADHGTRHASLLSDGDHAAGLDGTQAGVPRWRIFATATLAAKPQRW